MRLCSITIACALACLAGRPASAQDKPFVYSVSTATDTSRAQARVDLEVGVAERTFQSDGGYQPEQRVGVQASVGRWTLLGRFGLSDTGSAYQSSQSGEVLFALTPGRRFTLAAGGGVLHEAGGTNVLLSRVAVGSGGDAWTTQGNLVLQKPLSEGRDAADVLISAGIARRIASRASLGIEGIGEDLEGFWDAAEAEGGARLLVGPSLHVWSASHTWQFLCAGGPLLHQVLNGRSSDALRDLPPIERRVGYAVQAGLSITLAR